MANKFLVSLAGLVRRFFFIFLDISGILLGIFLSWLGWWMVSGRQIPGIMGLIILIIGVGAFIIHTGHYFQLKLTKWLFGENYFLTQDNKN